MRRRLASNLLISLIIGILFLPLVLFGTLFVEQAAANHPQCQSGAILSFGTRRWCGYFKNHFDNAGQAVRLAGIPGTTNTAQEFIDLIKGDLGSGNAQMRTGAQFVVLTMLGRGPGLPQSVTAQQLADWETRVKSYSNSGENGNQSFGENGRIDWFVSQHTPCDYVNTYWQDAHDDVAPYLDRPSNSDCELPWVTTPFIIFRDTSGTILYQIRRLCMNPMGQLAPLAEPQPNDYELTPIITPTVGGSSITGGVEVGQTIHFEYAVNNSKPDDSPSTPCNIYTNVHPGYFATPNPATGSGGAGPPTGCPKVFANGITPLTSEDVVIGAGNQTICRSLFVDRSSPSVGLLGTEVCVLVVSKPYLKVYGGDLSVGNGQSTAPNVCSSNPNAAVISWNKGDSPNYSAAGVQFGVLALGKIFEVATSVGNTGASVAPAPSGLAFANTTPSGSVYGGSMDSLPCIPDHFAAKPSDTSPFTTIPAATTSGAYSTSGAGPFNLSGAVASGKRITVYAQGDVFIDNNVTYPASWTSSDPPLFQLVVKGNIYIKNTVSRVDGMYIAQKDGASGGTIYTCATAVAPLAPGGTLASTCSGGLTINGAFVANQVQFLRTRGTRQQAPANENGTSNNIAEVFNFSPALWMAQPIGPSTGAVEYDSITGLPPIL